MRQSLLIIGLTLLLFASASVMAQNAKLTVKYSFTGIVDGYDHNTRTTIFLNDEELCTSKEHKESKDMIFSCDVPPGSYTVRVVNYAQYEGVWEEHTVENNYSIDAVFEKEMTFKKKKKYTIGLLFDLDNGTSVKKK